jgi:Terminase large subunit, T4likevirus-type, N-terminal/Terminase RNaseH-like domain
MAKQTLLQQEPVLVKRPHQKLVLTAHQQNEFLKCAVNPLYFVENYVWIQHSTQGKIPFALFDYQRELIDTYWKYRNVVAMCSRQLGKCVRGSTQIDVKHARTGQQQRLSIQQFYQQQRAHTWWLERMWARLRAPIPDLPEHYFKFTDVVDVWDWLVLTDTGWKPIKSIMKTVPYIVWTVKMEDGRTLECADKHRVIAEHGAEIFVQDLELGQRLRTDTGPVAVSSVTVSLLKEQMFDLEVLSEPHWYYTNGILSHNTATAGAFLLWYALFHKDVSILIAANKFRAATEIMDRIKFAYEELPDWLRAGVITYNVQKIVFDNGSKIESTTTTPDSGRGKSISLLFVDEFAFIKKRIAEEFWSAIGPTLATGGKCIVTSTPNSDEDTFAQIWFGANRTLDEFGNELPGGVGANGFRAFMAKWNQHPDRDQDWANKERAKFGYEKFAREYDLEFITADSTLIDSKLLATLHGVEPEFKTGEIRWWERPSPGNVYLVSLDPSAGIGRDYAAIQVWKLPQLQQVGEWMHNKSSVSQQLKTLVQICSYLDKELRASSYAEPEIFWTFENNSYGQAVIELLNEIGLDVIPATLVNEPGVTPSRSRRGLNTNGRTKNQAVTKLKSLLETNKMLVRSKPLISQLKSYVNTGGSFAAKSGEFDDLVSALLLVIRMSQHVARWDDLTAQQIKDDDLMEIEDLVEPMPISVSRW